MNFIIHIKKVVINFNNLNNMKNRLLDNTKNIIQNLGCNVDEYGFFENKHNMVFFIIDDVNDIDIDKLDEELKKNNLKLSRVDEINNRIFVKVM